MGVIFRWIFISKPIVIVFRKQFNHLIISDMHNPFLAMLKVALGECVMAFNWLVSSNTWLGGVLCDAIVGLMVFHINFMRVGSCVVGIDKFIRNSLSILNAGMEVKIYGGLDVVVICYDKQSHLINDCQIM